MGDLPERSSPLAQDVLLLVLPAPENPTWKRRVLERFPGLEVRWVDSRKPGGDYALPDEVPDEMWDGVTIYHSLTPASPERMSKVRFVQVSSAGVDLWVGHEVYQNPDVSFCTTNGCQSPQIAEWVISTWLSSQHHFLRYASNMKEGFWESASAVDVEDSLGLRIAAGSRKRWGWRFMPTREASGRRPSLGRNDSYCIPGTGDPEGLIPAKWFHGSSEESLNNFLSQGFDILVLCLPLTKETRGFFGKEQFDILSKRKTFVSNIARGGLMQNEALIEALETGKIRAAAVDVTDPEPLPKDHPLWKAPNIFITPHVSWSTKAHFERVLGLLEVNLERLHGGKPLINIVNRHLHY
ncbi:D-isomer specific 2-hydroxyacid dehydrogenase [Colletotrichum cereale]|nr:D-isomer specific 2-hydroxyacid dehydrogenase [Colletotrichum cereale]